MKMAENGKAVDFFSRGYNCCQSVMAAFAEDFKLEEDFLLKAGAGFGGGMGGSRITCGAVSAMVFFSGLAMGEYAPDDIQSKKKLYDQVKFLISEFTKEFGTTDCKSLLLKASCIPKPDPSVRNAEYYAKRPCAHFVAKAEELIRKHLLAEEPDSERV